MYRSYSAKATTACVVLFKLFHQPIRIILSQYQNFIWRLLTLFVTSVIFPLPHEKPSRIYIRRLAPWGCIFCINGCQQVSFVDIITNNIKSSFICYLFISKYWQGEWEKYSADTPSKYNRPNQYRRYRSNKRYGSLKESCDFILEIWYKQIFNDSKMILVFFSYIVILQSRTLKEIPYCIFGNK